MNHLIRIMRILVATLKEIFDEAPYARYLDRTRTTSSPSAYTAFCREREESRSRRPKCC